MNKQRRKWLEEIVERLETAKDEIDSVAEEEREAYKISQKASKNPIEEMPCAKMPMTSNRPHQTSMI